MNKKEEAKVYGGELVKFKEARQGTVDEIVQRMDDLNSKIDAFNLKMNGFGEKMNEFEKKSKSMKFTLDVGAIVVMGVVIVLFLAFIGLLIDGYRFKAQSYLDLKNSVDELKQDMFNERYSLLMERMTEIENNFVG